MKAQDRTAGRRIAGTATPEEAIEYVKVPNAALMLRKIALHYVSILCFYNYDSMFHYYIIIIMFNWTPVALFTLHVKICLIWPLH